MSGGAPSEQEKEIVHSFLAFVHESGRLEADQLEIMQQMLTVTYELEKPPKRAVKMTEVWPAGPEADAFDESKWQEFLEVLTEKGYFKGCEVGSEEHGKRLEKAKLRFIEKSNPYEGLSADQLKAKGNELMTQGQHKKAIGFYTKAIELDPENAVYYCNRAAAYTHCNQFADAVRDCEKSAQLKPDYSKAYSRLGTAHFYQNNWPLAAKAFKKACDLEPENVNYKQDLATAEEKLASAPPAVPGMPPGFGGLPGFDMNSIAGMMANPQFQQMAQSVMSNPNFTNMVRQMAEGMGIADGNGPDMAKMAEMFSARADPNQPAIDGKIPTPFGSISKDKLEAFRNSDQFKNNPKFQELQQALQTEGPMAMMRYMDDPEVMDSISKFTQLLSDDKEN